MPSRPSEPFNGYDEREWFPLWLAGPVVALVAMQGLIGIAMLLAEGYKRLAG